MTRNFKKNLHSITQQKGLLKTTAMIKSIIDPTNFDIEFRKISRNKRGVARSRIDFENIDVDAKIRLVIFLISKASHLDSVVYKILFWERDEKIEEYLLKI